MLVKYPNLLTKTVSQSHCEGNTDLDTDDRIDVPFGLPQGHMALVGSLNSASRQVMVRSGREVKEPRSASLS